MRRFTGALVALALALAMGGCVTQSSHTEGDREVNDQTMKAGAVVQDAIAAAVSAYETGKAAEAKTLLAQGAIAGAEIVKNAKQQEAVHGAPVRTDLPAFSPEASDAARKKSADDHASGKWVVPTLTVLGAVGGIAATLCGMPWLAQLFPALTGKIGKMAKTYVATINTVRTVAEAQGGAIDVGTVLAIAKDKNVQAGIQDIVALHAHAHEEAMGTPLTTLQTIIDADHDGVDDRLQEPHPAEAPVG